VELSVTGLLNGRLYGAHGSLTVDNVQGTKTGDIVYDPRPAGLAVGPDCTLCSTGKCFLGARPVSRGRFYGPLDLLGSEFVSIRSTQVGRLGNVSISERAVVDSGVIRSDLTAIGEYRVPNVVRVGPLRETIHVSGRESLSSEGRYSLVTKSGRRIPVRYIHLYRSLRPSRTLFSRLLGHAFLLRAEITPSWRGNTVAYHSRSTIEPI